jgi:hypothetical protein
MVFAAAVDRFGPVWGLVGLFVLSLMSFAATVALALRYRR